MQRHRVSIIYCNVTVHESVSLAIMLTYKDAVEIAIW